MERQFNNGDFEKLLRDNANQYRMYPSEKVWKGIHSALHTRRRWYGLTVAMFLLTGSVVSFIIFNDNHGKNNVTDQKNIANQSTLPVQNTSLAAKQVPFTPQVRKLEHVSAPISDLTKPYLSNSTPVDPVMADKNDQQEFTNTELNKISTIVVEPTASPSLNEEPHAFAEPLLNLVLVNDNTKAQIENQVYSDATTEKKLGTESLIDDNIEQRIKDAISALSSPNASITQTKKKARVTGQLYFTPTISYRKLTENKRVLNGSGYYVPVIDPKNMVKHKPAMGLEFGFEGRYRLSDNFSLKAGLQFNINRYDISAYSHPTEIATVALSSGYGIDSLATLSNYRNAKNYSANWLENFSFQASLPVGAEVILGRTKDVQWGVSATIQPTYVIGDRAYVISSDYQNYAKFPDLMRRWNISSGAGAFVSYSTGRIQWQVGPHVRYQHLSSFVSALTIKEKLYAIGFKVGATLK